MTNMAISTGSSRRAALLAALAGAFANDMTRTRTRRWSSARTAAGWCRARPAPTCSATGSACDAADRDYSTVAGFALSVLKRIPETGETFSTTAGQFEIVDMDGRKIDKLLVSAARRRGEDASARRRRASLKLAEALLEAVDVAAREIVRLLDDPVAA